MGKTNSSSPDLPPASRPPPWAADPAIRWLWLAFALISLWRLGAAWLLPVTQDEAYYIDWASRLDWGYFDHPPGVALLAIGSCLAPASALAGRLGNLLAATLTLWVLIRFYRACGLTPQQQFLALVVTAATFGGLISGVLTTPDTPLALAWALALHEALAALRGDRRRWVTAGLATGLGLLGKYGMALIGPVFLWAILWADPRALRTPWPYLGALAALLVFAPNLVWNAQNDWLTLRFQFGHGFSTTAGVADAATGAIMALPTRVSPLAGAGLGERLMAVLSFLGIQAALWGCMLLPLLAGLWLSWRRRSPTVIPVQVPPADFPAAVAVPPAIPGTVAGSNLAPQSPDHPVSNQRSDRPASLRSQDIPGRPASPWSQAIPASYLSPNDAHALSSGHMHHSVPLGLQDRPARALLVAGTLFPLGFFALVAAFSPVQPNWAILYLLTAIPLLALVMQRVAKAMLIAALINLLLVSVYVFHARTGLLPLPDKQQRILYETHGFAALAEEVKDLPGPLFADRYQLVAMMRFHAPGLEIGQWPGLFRPSEYLRGRLRPTVDPAAVARAGGFWLLSRDPYRPGIPGFQIERQRLLYDCLREGLREAVTERPEPCAAPLHRWWLVRYVPEPIL